MAATRPYQSPLRAQMAQQTRALILDALIEVVSADGADDLSIRDLAERAGVSQRTVYRHFPDRAALLDALAEHVGDRIGWGEPMAAIGSLDELVDAIPVSFAGFDRHETETRALVLLNLDPARVAAITRRNQSRLAALVAAELVGLDADERAEAVAVLHLLASSRTWLRFRDQDGLAPGQAGRAAQGAAGAYVADLRRTAPLTT